MKLLRDQSGASAAEYAMILAVVGTAIVAAAILLGHAVGGSINQTAECLISVSNC